MADADDAGETMSKAAKSQKKYLDVRSIVRDDSFWQDSEEVISILKKQLRFIKHSDESRSMMGFDRASTRTFVF